MLDNYKIHMDGNIHVQFIWMENSISENKICCFRINEYLLKIKNKYKYSTID